MRLVSCTRCGRIHGKGQCRLKPLPGRHRDSEATQVHHSNDWTKKSLEVRDRDGSVCQFCLRKEKRICRTNLSVHHIVPLEEAPEKAYEGGNLITLCSFHHEQAEKGAIGREILREWAKENECKFA